MHKVLSLLSALEADSPLLLDANSNALEQQRQRQSQYNFYSKKG